MVADERDGWIERTVKEDEDLREEGWRRCEGLVESWKAMRGKAAFKPLGIEALGGKGMT